MPTAPPKGWMDEWISEMAALKLVTGIPSANGNADQLCCLQSYGQGETEWVFLQGVIYTRGIVVGWEETS